MNSDIYSAVLTGKKLIVLVLDNGGFAVINKLQNNTGQVSFNNLIADCPTVPTPSPSISPPMPRHGGACRNRRQPR
jgi:3D-(3,5/4)-trihydroxycyclohexane-1,2-dione acylhydrolase (decyclizing)